MTQPLQRFAHGIFGQELTVACAGMPPNMTAFHDCEVRHHNDCPKLLASHPRPNPSPPNSLLPSRLKSMYLFYDIGIQ